MHLHHLERLQGPRGTEERVRGGGVLPAVREALRKLEQRRGRHVGAAAGQRGRRGGSCLVAAVWPCHRDA